LKARPWYDFLNAVPDPVQRIIEAQHLPILEGFSRGKLSGVRALLGVAIRLVVAAEADEIAHAPPAILSGSVFFSASFCSLLSLRKPAPPPI